MPPSKLYGTFPRSATSLLLLNENRFAYVALRELVRPRTKLSERVVFLYGPSGVGKTLLALQFIRDLKQSEPRHKIVHITAGRFAADLAEASERKTIPKFASRFREAETLICEDLSELERRPESQIQLIYILDEIRNSGGRVLITSKKMPGELDNVSPRLVNRCHSGVCVAVSSPGFASRKLLIRQFAESRQIPIPQGVVEILARSLAVSPRELLAAVIKLDAISRLGQSPINSSLAQRYLDNEVRQNPPTLSQISRAVATQFKVSVAQLRSPDRRKSHILPRQCAMYLARQLAGESLQQIAKYYGRTHYSTVIHACKRTGKRHSQEPAIRQDLAEIYQKLGVNPPVDDE